MPSLNWIGRRTMNQMKILVSGSLVYDRIMDFPGRFRDYVLSGAAHDFAMSFVVDTLKENFGGTAGNIAYNLALLGEKPVVFGSVGNDFARYRSWLARHGVDTRFIKTFSREPTAECTVITDKADNQISAIHLGAMRYPSAPQARFFPGADFAVVSPGNMKDMNASARICRARRIPYMCDPGQMMPSLPADELKRMIQGAAIFVSNDYEFALAVKKTRWSRKKILSYVDVLVTTLGEKGSVIWSKGKKYIIPPAKPKNTLDPTGAGDAYRAGFIKCVLAGLPLDVAGRFASVVACYTIETYGTQTHSFTLAEVKKRYQKNFGPLSTPAFLQ